MVSTEATPKNFSNLSLASFKADFISTYQSNVHTVHTDNPKAKAKLSNFKGVTQNKSVTTKFGLATHISQTEGSLKCATDVIPAKHGSDTNDTRAKSKLSDFKTKTQFGQGAARDNDKGFSQPINFPQCKDSSGHITGKQLKLSTVQISKRISTFEFLGECEKMKVYKYPGSDMAVTIRVSIQNGVPWNALGSQRGSNKFLEEKWPHLTKRKYEEGKHDGMDLTHDFDLSGLCPGE